MKKFILPFIVTVILLNSMQCFAATSWVVIPIKFYYDKNTNCVKDATELFGLVPLLIQVDSNGVPVDTISATSGFDYYHDYCPAGTVFKFSILAAPGSPAVICPSSGFVTDTIAATSTIYPAKYFGLTCPTTSTFDLAEHAIIPLTDRGGQWGYIYVGNNSCNPVNGTLTFNFSPKYYSPSISGNTMTWSLTSLIAEEHPDRIYFKLKAAATLVAGDTVQSHITVTPISGDSNPINNSELRIDTIRESHDPNDISVLPAGCIASAVSPVELKYTIRFENTGNDTADNIYVMDTLSEYLDLNTLRLEMTTHPMFIDIRTDETSGKGILKFDFPDIKLLDSSHHDECDGAVMYTIKTKPGLPMGTHIYNYAGIYFDLNPVVITNTANNIIGCPTIHGAGANNNKVNPSTCLYPNPAANQLTIKAEQNVYTSFTITNSMGQVLIQQPMSAAQTDVDIKALAPGLYYVAVRGEGGTKTMKFVKTD